MRKAGRLTSASLSASNELPVDQPILDCPAHSQTSPTATFLTWIWFWPTTLNEWPVPRDGVSRKSFHRPFSSALPDTVDPQLAETVTASPGSAHPQTVFFVCRCRTMLSPSSRGSRTSALARSPIEKTMSVVRNGILMLDSSTARAAGYSDRQT